MSTADSDARHALVRAVTIDERAEWLRLRLALWPEDSPAVHEEQMREVASAPDQAALVLVRPDGRLGGFIEASIHPRAVGCSTHNVGYVEGWYVDPDLRGRGCGRRLMQAAEAWARGKGLSEMASDTQTHNHLSLAAHVKLGYTEVERLIHFCKRL